MSIIEWENDSFLLHMPIMDETHKEFVVLVNQLSAASDKEFAALFEHFIEHTKQHFMQEESFMIETDFPAYSEHRAEHQRILGEFNQFKKRVDKGLIAFARNYINDSMPGWFRLHAATMDSALAMHLNKTGIIDKKHHQTATHENIY